MLCTKPRTTGVPFPVPCGRCKACRAERAREWSLRMMHESYYHERCVFVTLTYKELPAYASLEKEELVKFFKRVRKALEPSGRKFKYYACGEYGEQYDRPHYHVIFFGLSVHDYELFKVCWTKGFVCVKPFTGSRARYTANYVQKKLYKMAADQIYGKRQPDFQLVSKGLGKQYCLEYQDQIKANLVCTLDGVPAGLPRYYVKKLDIPTEARAVKADERRAASEAAHKARIRAEDPNGELLADSKVKSMGQAVLDREAKLKLKPRGVL